MSWSPLDWEIVFWESNKLHIFIYPLGWWSTCVCVGSMDMFARYIQEWYDKDGYHENGVMERHYDIGPFGIDIKSQLN